MSWEVLFLLFACGLSAGFIDAIAGGGGLITVPALLRPDCRRRSRWARTKCRAPGARPWRCENMPRQAS